MSPIYRLLLAAAAISGFSRSAEANPVAPPARGDRQVVVSVNSAPLMRGGKTLTTVRYGQRLNVIEVKGPWIGTAVMVDGRRIGGWVWNGQTATPDRFAAGRQAVRRYSYQPSASAERSRAGGYPNSYRTNTLLPDMGDYNVGGFRSSSPLIIGETPYGRGYWRADRKVIGN
jgi:hypothetical protein